MNIDSIQNNQQVLLDSNRILNQRLLMAQETIHSLGRKSDSIIYQNQKLSLQIDGYQNDLLLKQAQLERLRIENKKLQVGQLEYYDFNGALRKQDGGSNTLLITETFQVFQEMDALLLEKRYKELVPLCQKQIKNKPTWYTPYLYLGIAHFNLGETRKAEKYFRFLIDEVSVEPYLSESLKFMARLGK